MAGSICGRIRNANGTLALELHLPAELDVEPRIVVRCNGQVSEFHLERENFLGRRGDAGNR